MNTATVDTRTAVETPENVLLTFQLAGPGARMGAYLIDLAIRCVIAFCIVMSLTLVTPVLGAEVPIGLVLVGMFLLEWGYAAVFEGLFRGQTPGKRYFRLRVVKDGGFPINFQDAALRNLLRAADILPFGYSVGLISMILTKRLQRLGDLAAGTIVVLEEQPHFHREVSAFDQLAPLLPQECTGRFYMSERTLDVIERLLARREDLPKRRVEEIARILSEPVAAKLGYQLQRDTETAPDIYFLRRVLRTFSTIG